jgi:predicted phage-related endonuclease
MPEYIKTFEQCSPEWWRYRCGSVGGSGIGHVLAKGQGKTRQSYLYLVASEILSGKPAESYTSPAMERGKLLEPEARQLYEFMTGNVVEQVALIRADMDRVHVSPDGIVGGDGGIEIKTMLPHTYVELVDTEKIDIKYIRQVQHFFFVSGRSWCDFVAYCPEITKRPVWINRLTPVAEVQQQIAEELPRFFSDLDRLIEKIAP